MTKDEEKYDAVDVVEGVEEKAEDAAGDTKQAAGDSSAFASLTDTFASAKTSTGDALATLKGWSQTTGSAVGGVFSTVRTWEEEGTPLRGVFKSARLSLDDVACKLREQNATREEKMKERMEEMMKRRKQFDDGGTLSKCRELKRQHPELVVGGVTLAVALPSALAGKRAFFRNGAAALTVSAGVVYGVGWFKRRMAKQSEGWTRDSGATRP